MELRELHALVTGVTVTSYSYSTGYSYSYIVSHSSVTYYELHYGTMKRYWSSTP